LAEYRDRYAALKAAGVELVAISADAASRAAPMKADLRLPYTVLCDPARELIIKWGLLNEKEMGGIAYPAVFAIDRDLTVRFCSLDKTTNRASAKEVTAIVKTVTEGGSVPPISQRRLKPGSMFIRAALNAVRRGARTPR
jgi:peroxiredoxin